MNRSTSVPFGMIPSLAAVTLMNESSLSTVNVVLALLERYWSSPM